MCKKVVTVFLNFNEHPNVFLTDTIRKFSFVYSTQTTAKARVVALFKVPFLGF